MTPADKAALMARIDQELARRDAKENDDGDRPSPDDVTFPSMGGELRRCSGTKGVPVMSEGMVTRTAGAPDGDGSAPVGYPRGRTAKPHPVDHLKTRGERVASLSAFERACSAIGHHVEANRGPVVDPTAGTLPRAK
jgi:hypothetical protein